MQDKTILITGGNDGIGRAAARELARRGAGLILACRSRERGQAAADEIRRQTGNERLRVVRCDLASFDSIREAAGEVAATQKHLDVLINNAGVFTSGLEKTEEGFEKQFGVNHLGHFLLTRLLLDRLQAAPAPRIVNVASLAHLRGDIDFDNLRGEKGADRYSAWGAYAQSKLANILFTRELARRYPGIDSNCLHPGTVSTQFGNKATNWYSSLLWTIIKPFMTSVDKGAATSVYLAAAPQVSGVSGAYFDEKQRQRNPSERARDDALAEKLWEVSEGFCG